MAFIGPDLAGEGFLLDDFSSPDQTSEIGTAWEGFTDRVMGGKSDMSAGVVPAEGRNALRMRGNVSLENNGGFIQVRLPLGSSGKPFDAGRYTGIAVTARTEAEIGDGYYIHLRTPRTVFPWAYYAAPLPVSGDWQRIEVPFSAFQSEFMVKNKLNKNKLLSVAIVAAKKQFSADIYVSRVEFY